MESDARSAFEAVTVGEQWGIADASGFHQSETHRYASSGAYPFSVCRIAGRQIAVFIEMTTKVEARAELERKSPTWLDATVYASLISEPHAEVGVIAAHTVKPGNFGLQTCAFASACVAFSLGLFKAVPKYYLVRFEGRATVRVRMEFNADAETWFGEAAIDS